MSDEKVVKKQWDFSIPLMAVLFVSITYGLYGVWMALTAPMDASIFIACAIIAAIISGILSLILTMTVTK